MKMNAKQPRKTRGAARPSSGRAVKGLSIASAVFAVISAAHAQQQAAATGGLEEIIVTAEKRSESLQNVPLSITALGTAKLEELHVQKIDDYIKYLPSVSYQSTGPGFAKIYMRGVSSGGDGNHSGSLPSVGVYLDEQPITTIQGPLDVHVYDIARVEALAGPQGTLYGASSEAGTIRIITNKPEFNVSKGAYDVQLNSVKHGDPGGSFEGFYNLPITSNAAVRLVGWYEKEGGYIDNVPGSITYPAKYSDGSQGYGLTNDNRGTPANPVAGTKYYGTAKKAYNDVETYGGRAALRVALGDNWTITPGLQAQTTKANGIFATQQTKVVAGYPNLYPTLGDLEVQHYNPESSRDSWLQATLTVEGKIANLDVTYAGGFVHRTDETHSDYTDYSLGYALYYHQGPTYFTDNAGNSINPTQDILGRDGYKMYSHELRFSTPKEYPVRATFGGFLQQQQHQIEQRYGIPGLADNGSVGYQTQNFWPNTYWLTRERRINRDNAIFGEVTWDVTSNFSVLGGLRYYDYNNSLQGWYGFDSYRYPKPSKGRTGCANPSNPAPDPNGGPCQNLFRTTDGTGTTPKVTLTYKFDDRRLIYATYSKGFRPGGVNRVATPVAYEPDTLKNYEIGWKTSWLGNTLRFNGAVFQEDWTNFQFSFLGPNSVTIIRNAGGARIRGLETSLEWQATDALNLNGSLTLMDPKLTVPFCKYPDANNGIQTGACNDYSTPDSTTGLPYTAHDFGAPKGQQLPTTPKFKGNLTARYKFGLGNDWDGHVQGTLVYQSYVWSDLRTNERADLGQQPAYALFDMNVGAARGPYAVELYVNNVFDRRAEIYRYAECTESTCGAQSVYHGIYKPRLIGLTFSQKF